MIATTGQKATSGPLTTHDPLALTGAGSAAAVAGASPIPHPMTCPGRTIDPLEMVIVPPRNIVQTPGTVRTPSTTRAAGTAPVLSASQARATALAQSTVVAKPGPSALSVPSTPMAWPQATTRALATVLLVRAMVTDTPATLAAPPEAKERTTGRLPAAVGPATTPPFRTAVPTPRLAVTSDREAANTVRTTVPEGQAVVLLTGQGPTIPTRPVMTGSGPRNSLRLGVILRPPMIAGWRAVITARELPTVPQLSARAPEAGLQVHTGRPGPVACSRDWVASARNPAGQHGRIAAPRPANRVRAGVATTRDRGQPTYRRRGRPASQQPDTE